MGLSLDQRKARLFENACATCDAGEVDSSPSGGGDEGAPTDMEGIKKLKKLKDILTKVKSKKQME